MALQNLVGCLTVPKKMTDLSKNLCVFFSAPAFVVMCSFRGSDPIYYVISQRTDVLQTAVVRYLVAEFSTPGQTVFIVHKAGTIFARPNAIKSPIMKKSFPKKLRRSTSLVISYLPPYNTLWNNTKHYKHTI